MISLSPFPLGLGSLSKFNEQKNEKIKRHNDNRGNTAIGFIYFSPLENNFRSSTVSDSTWYVYSY